MDLSSFNSKFKMDGQCAVCKERPRGSANVPKCQAFMPTNDPETGANLSTILGGHTLDLRAKAGKWTGLN